MAHETTKKHFEFFAKECKRLQKLFLLDTWELVVRHGTSDDARCDGALEVQTEGRVLEVQLARWLFEEPTPEYLKAIARHECLHAVMQPLGRLCRDRWVMPQLIDSASHEVLRRIDLLLPK